MTAAIRPARAGRSGSMASARVSSGCLPSKTSWSLPPNARTIRLARRSYEGLEPEKAANHAPLVVVDTATAEIVQHLFFKCGSAHSRGLPLWLTAVASFSGNREVYFYLRVRSLLTDVDFLVS